MYGLIKVSIKSKVSPFLLPSAKKVKGLNQIFGKKSRSLRRHHEKKKKMNVWRAIGRWGMTFYFIEEHFWRVREKEKREKRE